MVRLIERELEKDGSAIDRHVGIGRSREIGDGDRTHPEVRLHAVGRHACSLDTHGHFVKKGIIERPPVRVRQRDRDVNCRRAARDLLRDLRLGVTIRECQTQCQIVRRRVAQPRLDNYAREVSARREMDRFERVRTARLEIHRLPHPMCGAVPLLAFELELMRPVVDTDDESLRLADAQVTGELEREWRVSPVVRAETLPVEPRRGAPIRRAEHEEDSPTAPPR